MALWQIHVLLLGQLVILLGLYCCITQQKRSCRLWSGDCASVEPGVEIWEDPGPSPPGPGAQPLQRVSQSINSTGNLLLSSAISMEEEVFSSTFHLVGEKVF